MFIAALEGRIAVVIGVFLGASAQGRDAVDWKKYQGPTSTLAAHTGAEYSNAYIACNGLFCSKKKNTSISTYRRLPTTTAHASFSKHPHPLSF
jgi:hypothetical protein